MLNWHLVLVYILMFLYMYIAPGLGQTTPWGQMLMSTESPYHFAQLLQVLNNLLKYDFKHILNFIYVYRSRAGTDNPLGTKFWCQQKFLITLPICCQFKKNLFEVWFFTIFFFVCVFHMYIAPGRGRQPNGDKNFMTIVRPFLFAHMLQVSKWPLRNPILYIFLMSLYMYIVPGQGQKTPRW